MNTHAHTHEHAEIHTAHMPVRRSHILTVLSRDAERNVSSTGDMESEVTRFSCPEK